MNMTNITIDGTIIQVGMEPWPHVIIENEQDGKIRLCISREEAIEFGKHLYGEATLHFNATVSFVDYELIKK